MIRVSTARQLLVGLRVMVVMTVLLGVLYPLAVWGVAQASMPGRADGQQVRAEGRVVGSAIIGQHRPVKDDGWFHGRPSTNDYDPLASAPSNLGPSNPDLLDAIRQRRASIAKVEGVTPAAVPADAVTASASGLDAYVSPAYAALQVDRVARERDLPRARVLALVERRTSERQLGFLGQPRVNVQLLNVDLLRLCGQGACPTRG